MHIYETQSWWGTDVAYNWAEDENQIAFQALLLQYKDKIIVEVTGHDHLADVRAASGDCMNKVIFPGLTSNTYQQPGYGTFIYDDSTQKATDLKMTFVDLNASASLPEDATMDQFTWFDLDFKESFGLEDLSAEEINDLATRLWNEPETRRKYEFNRMGVELSNTELLEQGFDAYQNKYQSICSTSTVDTAFDSVSDFVIPYCVMTASENSASLLACNKLYQTQNPCPSSAAEDTEEVLFLSQ